MKANKLIELTLAAIMLIFAACSGGDDNGGSNSGGNTDPKSSVNITTSSPTVPQAGASTTVSFVVSGSWTASSNQSWCHVSPTSGNQGTTTITVTCDDNDTYDERNATVTIKCGNASSSITVTQKQKDALLVTSNKIEIEAAGGEATIEVKANVDYDYAVEESAKSWISIGGTRALTTKNIILNIAENESTSKREGKITISNSDFKEEVTVYQQGAAPSIVLTAKEFTVASIGETIKVELMSNTNYTIQMPNVKWITESASSSYTHYFKVEENTTYDSRSAEIIFKNEDNGIEEKVTVNQLQKDAIVLAKSSYGVGYEATQLDFSVQSNVDLVVSTSDSWIKQVSTRALTEKKLYFDIEENTSDSERKGYIYVTSGDLKQTISITQADRTPYLTFKADAEQTLYLNRSFEYSVNYGEWAKLSSTGVTFGGTKGNLRLRGKSSVSTNGAKISFGNSTKVSCSGDIRTLNNYENYETITESGIFKGFFRNCVQLISAPELPATNLAEGCYKEMFSGCTSLTKAPELPATNLAESCYNNMFYGCTSLTKAPELPATNLAESCYNYMFSGCTSLTKAPELPATNLAESCYAQMFYGCTSLTQAPELPATNLAESCYNYMFSGCTSLTQAPELPATNLAKGCYVCMFSGCTSLTQAPELPATNLAESCYNFMFSGCTSLTQAPELPATTVEEFCYEGMFSGCTSLTQAPELPATNLAKRCYEWMFSGCTSLTKAPELPATNLAESCYSEMFSGCTSLTKAPELPATTVEEYCYRGMFKGCTSLTQAPELPALIVTHGGNYVGMFYNCTKLNYIKVLAVTYRGGTMLDGVSNEGIFIKNSAANENDYWIQIPEGWTIIYYNTDSNKYYLDKDCTKECDDHGKSL